jgi:hypothetical protein
MNEQIKEVYKKLSEIIISRYENSIKIIDNLVKEKLLPLIKELNDECKKELNRNELELNQIEDEIHYVNLGQAMTKCPVFVYNKLNKNISFSIQDVSKHLKLNEAKKGISIELTVKKINARKITGNSVLEIVNEDDQSQSYQVDMDLDYLKFNEESHKTVSFNPYIQKAGTYYYKLKIKQGYDDISNEAELALCISEIGNNEDLLD